MKNHLLFNANHILCFHICAIPTLDYTNLKLDGLISLMSSTWNSMVAKGVSSPACTAPSSSMGPTVSKFLSDTEREASLVVVSTAGNPLHLQVGSLTVHTIALVTSLKVSFHIWSQDSQCQSPLLPSLLLAQRGTSMTIISPTLMMHLWPSSPQPSSCVLGNEMDSGEDWDDDD